MVIGFPECLGIPKAQKSGLRMKRACCTVGWSSSHPLPEAFKIPDLVLSVRQDQPGLLWDWIWPAKNTRWGGTTGIWKKIASSGIYNPKGRFLICNHSVLFTQPCSWMLPHAETTQKAHTPLAFHLRCILGVEHALCKF